MTGVAISWGVRNRISASAAILPSEVTGSLYAGYAAGPFWGNVIGSYGSLNYDVNRLATVGKTIQSNNGTTDGHDLSASFEGGYKFT